MVEKETAQAEKEAAVVEKEAALAEKHTALKNIVQNMYQSDFSIDVISSMTGLTQVEIKSILHFEKEFSIHVKNK